MESSAASLQSPLGTSRVAQHTEDYTCGSWVLQRFGFHFSSPQPTPLSTSHSLSAPPSDEFVEPSGPYPALVGCLMYLMTCTRTDLTYPLSLLARYVAPGRHRKVHWDAAERVLRYLCSTSGMGLVLGGWGPVVLTGHADASWVDDSATQRSTQSYTFSLAAGTRATGATGSLANGATGTQAAGVAGSVAKRVAGAADSRATGATGSQATGATVSRATGAAGFMASTPLQLPPFPQTSLSHPSACLPPFPPPHPPPPLPPHSSMCSSGGHSGNEASGHSVDEVGERIGASVDEVDGHTANEVNGHSVNEVNGHTAVEVGGG
ncbi:unnamed protein product [Closterium sp. NIES-54]